MFVTLFTMMGFTACETDGEQKSGLVILLTDQEKDTTLTAEEDSHRKKLVKVAQAAAPKTATTIDAKSKVKLNNEILEEGGNSEQVTFLQKAHALTEENKNKEALKVYQQLLVKYPDCYIALCKVSYLYAELGNKTEDEALKKQYLEKAVEYANNSLAMRPDDAESNYVKALSEGYIGNTVGMRKRMDHYKKVKTHLDKAIASEPGNDKAWFALGLWNATIAQMNTIEYNLAKIVIGSDAAKASYRNAAKAFENAAKNNPGVLAYHYYLGKALLKANETRLAKQHLEKAVSLKAVNAEDEEHRLKAKEMLANI